MHPYPHLYTVQASASPEGDVPLACAGLPTLTTAPPAEFDGPGDRWSPETLLVGAVADPVFGPVIAVGAGGVTVELTRDVAVRVAPLTDLDADEMVRSLATFPLLDGFRGAEKADVAALVDVVLRLGAIATAHDAIAEMDCNPVIVHTHGAVVVDARISVQTPSPPTPFGARSQG